MKGLVVNREAQMIGVYIPELNETLRGIPSKKVVKSKKIFAGDYVIGRTIDDNHFFIEKLEERKNFLKRPPVANVDTVLVVATLKFPDFDNFLIDNLLIVYEYLKTEPILIFNKIDLLDNKSIEELKRWEEIYAKAGYKIVKVSAKNGEGIENLKEVIKGNISIFAGSSGVGKSSILSKLLGIELEIGEISNKLKRGKHTTTGVKLFRFNQNSFVGDTPGFSKVNALYFMDKREVKNYFREFRRYRCKFPDCTHTIEPDCKVLQALKNGDISNKRYESYLKLIKKL